jgi:hypothetical protein
MTLEVPVENDAFHVVRQDILGNPHVAKGVNHANEQVFLFGIGEELYVPLATVVTDHGEAGCGVFCPVIVQNLSKAPVHLVSVSWFCSEPATTVALWCYQLPLCRHKVFVGCDVVFDCCQSTGISHSLQPFQTDG